MFDFFSIFFKNPETALEFTKRVKTWCWEYSWLVAAGGVDLLAQSLDLFNIPTWAVGIIGVTLTQISKTINKRRMAKNGS